MCRRFAGLVKAVVARDAAARHTSVIHIEHRAPGVGGMAVIAESRGRDVIGRPL